MSSQPTAATGFRVLSMGQDQPVPTGGQYDWDDDLCEPGATTVCVGHAHFDGTVQGAQITCTGWIELDGGAGWQGRIDLSGTLDLVGGAGGLVGEGNLGVRPSPATLPFRTVHVDRVNPKRYVTQN